MGSHLDCEVSPGSPAPTGACPNQLQNVACPRPLPRGAPPIAGSQTAAPRPGALHEDRQPALAFLISSVKVGMASSQVETNP